MFDRIRKFFPEKKTVTTMLFAPTKGVILTYPWFILKIYFCNWFLSIVFLTSGHQDLRTPPFVHTQYSELCVRYNEGEESKRWVTEIQLNTANRKKTAMHYHFISFVEPQSYDNQQIYWNLLNLPAICGCLHLAHDFSLMTGCGSIFLAGALGALHLAKHGALLVILEILHLVTHCCVCITIGVYGAAYGLLTTWGEAEFSTVFTYPAISPERDGRKVLREIGCSWVIMEILILHRMS